MSPVLTVALCVYNGAPLIAGVIGALRAQHCPLPFEILVVDNNSSDATAEIARQLATQPGAPLRIVQEKEQGIPHARNRAIEESREREFLCFIDIDEIPGEHWLGAAVDALSGENAECVGGEIIVHFPDDKRPRWLTDELLAFLGALRHGNAPFWITDTSTPVWSGNVGYRLSVFSDGLRFDHRYNRVGKGVGGGSDAVMFRTLVDRSARIRYRPDMLIEHHVDEWKITRRYFLHLHYTAGCKYGRFQLGSYPRTILGMPPFMITLAIRQCLKTITMLIAGNPGYVRQAMNASHAIGALQGRIQRRKD